MSLQPAQVEAEAHSIQTNVPHVGQLAIEVGSGTYLHPCGGAAQSGTGHGDGLETGTGSTTTGGTGIVVASHIPPLETWMAFLH